MKTATVHGCGRGCRWVGGVVLALFLVACGDRNANSGGDTATRSLVRVQTENAKSQALANRILTSSQIEPGDWQPLYFGTGGMVSRVLVVENDRVRKGQLLAELDITSQFNQLEKAKLSLQKAQMDEAQALHDLENIRKVYESEGASKEQVFDQEQRYEEAKLKTQQDFLNVRSQEIRLEQMRLRAPFDGILTEVNIRVGEQVRGDVEDPDREMNRRPPMVISNPNEIRTLRVHIPEGRAGGVEVGTPVEIALMEHRHVVLDGEVTRVSETVDRDTRTVDAEVVVHRPEAGYPGELRDGSATLVTLFTRRREHAVTVSEQALYYYHDQAYVFVVGDGNRLEQRPVTLGMLVEGRVEISQGLSAGERVARSQLYLLRDGQTVLTEDSP